MTTPPLTLDPAGHASEDPWGSPVKPRESDVVTRLRTAREKAWPELRPAFDVAIMQARQADYEADRASTIAMSGFEAAYSPLVLALAESVEAPAWGGSWGIIAGDSKAAAG